MSEHRQLIDQLAGELTPVRRMPPVALMTVGWLLFLAVTVVVAINLSGPIRPGAYTEAISNGQFSIELILGLLTIAVAGWRCRCSRYTTRQSAYLARNHDAPRRS